MMVSPSSYSSLFKPTEQEDQNYTDLKTKWSPYSSYSWMQSWQTLVPSDSWPSPSEIGSSLCKDFCSALLGLLAFQVSLHQELNRPDRYRASKRSKNHHSKRTLAYRYPSKSCHWSNRNGCFSRWQWAWCFKSDTTECDRLLQLRKSSDKEVQALQVGRRLASLSTYRDMGWI